jgi:protoheme ferro-lyase
MFKKKFRQMSGIVEKNLGKIKSSSGTKKMVEILEVQLKNKYFGVKLEVVPDFLIDCLECLEKNAIKQPNIFRVNGKLDVIEEIKDQIENEEKINFNEIKDFNDIAGLLKLWLREIPEPLLLYSNYEFLLEASSIFFFFKNNFF